jgi:zinc/manganese transport system substrate-binding protein
VASTDVWGSVARAVAGDAAEVKSIINDPSADPHAYESKPADAAEVTNADLVVFNGGGYDDFMPKILEAVGDKPTVEAFALETQQPADGALPNEHVWYDLSVAQSVAQQVADKLGQLDPGQAQQFTARAQAFRTEIDGLESKLASIARAHRGQQVAMTEPVAQYLITAAESTRIPVVTMTETMPENTDYRGWMSGQIDALSAALQGQP